MVAPDSERFPIQSHSDDFERPWVDSEDERDLHAATMWTLHLRVPDTTTTMCIAPVQEMADKILRSGAEVLTGHYIGGDSFAEWCEVFDSQGWYKAEGRALHIYFTAPTMAEAQRVGGELAKIAYDPWVNMIRDPGMRQATLRVDCHVSTAGDWAEQCPIVLA